MAREVLEKYIAAWEKKNGFTQGGDFIINWVYAKQGTIISDGSIGPSAWFVIRELPISESLPANI